jgi:hypothetical protein
MTTELFIDKDVIDLVLLDGLITLSVFTDREDPDFNRRSTTSVLPSHAAR